MILNLCKAAFCTNSAMGKLSGKTALVTASTEGIGFAIARRLGQDGAKVVVSSRKQDNVDKAVQSLRKENIDVTGIVCHVAKPDDRKNLIKQTVERYGGIDVFVSNAAVNPIFGPMLETTGEIWDKIFDVNVKSTFLLCKEVVPHMEQRGGGSIIIVSSIGGFQPFSVLGCYSVSKTALLGLTKALIPELAGKNIRINGICPGVIKTKFSGALWKNPDLSEEMMKTIPIGRFGESEDISGLASFLACDDSAYVTGENIVVAGGTQSRL